jgi:hypothetical protein
VHILDDLDSLSPRAREFVRRAAWREGREKSRIPTDFLQIRDPSDRLISAPTELVIRREGFADRFGGLRYEVRRSAFLGRDRYDVTRLWNFDLDEEIRKDGRSWCFGWTGEHVSSPVRFLAHTDGRVGVSDGGPFLEIASSITQLIESHALTDEVSSWEPLPSSLEPWVSSCSALDFVARVVGLTLVPEASGRFERWYLSDAVAVREFWTWTSQHPRTRGVMLWRHSKSSADHTRRT